MFESDLMKIQSSIISTCIEFTQNKADYIFVFLYVKDEANPFINAFFRFGRETWDIEELEYPNEMVEYFQLLIKQDVDRLLKLFEQAKREQPVLYKMKYRCKDQKFKFELEYDKECSIDGAPEQEFYGWKNSEKKKYGLFF